MDKFFDRFKPKAGNKSGNSNNKNLFSNLRLPGQQSNFSGQGQSLGGGQPGRVIPIQLEEPGPLGVKVERRPNSQGTAIVAEVVENSQAARAGLLRGDVLCFAGSDGREEIMYDMFLELAKSDQRPLCFEVRRVPTKASSGGPNDNNSNNRSSAETFARKQAVIAAAEAREKAHKQKSKPIKRQTKTTMEQQQAGAFAQASSLEQDNEPRSDAAKQAVAAAKSSEAQTAAALGYNPYETNRATAGQARTATVAMTHGTMQGTNNGNGGARADAAIPSVRPPSNPAQPEGETVQVGAAFEQAFEMAVTSNDHNAVIASFGILRKLMINATTKGQDTSVADAFKFRRVRLANAKIKAAIVDVEGALDMMLSVGFILTEDDGESILVFPEGDDGPSWLPEALKRMEKYEKS